MSPFHFFMTKTAFAMLDASINANDIGRSYSRSASSRMRYLAIFTPALKFSLKKYATDEIVAETESNIMRFAQPSKMKLYRYTDKLVTKAL